MIMRWCRESVALAVLALNCLMPAAQADMAELLPLPAEPEQAIQLPAGFKLQVFASIPGADGQYFRGPRFMAFGPDGNLYLSTGMDRQVLMLIDADRDGKAEQIVTVADQLNAPQGLAFVGDKLLVANQDAVLQLERNAQGEWPAARMTPLISGLATGGHGLKGLKLGPDGHLYLNIGSSCNACVETDPTRATIERYTTDGKAAGALVTLGRHKPSATWARGLRNSQGFAWHPRTGAMYATNNGSDMRSASRDGAVDDELPPEHLNLIEPNQHYGWPYCWGKQVPDPQFGDADFCKTTRAPEIMFDAHSTPIGISFLDKTAFPEEYRTDAIVAQHGSWNRQEPVGYKLVRVKFRNDKPVEVVDFATGWLQERAAWGRPVDVINGPDGALYVSDDRAGLVYRISYKEQKE